MIKDRVIQKRIMGKVLAMAMTAVMTSLFVPVGASAADVNASTTHTVSTFSNNLILTNNKQIGWHWEGQDGNAADNCYDANGVCRGHKIMSSGSGGYGIKVEKGANHRIVLSGANISAASTSQISALELEDSATVTLVLDGESTLTSAAGYAGIHVPSSANLIIQSANGKDASGNERDKLTARSPHGAAGIGGAGYSGPNATAGSITIEGGMIFAEGGNTGAGIGAAGSGKASEIKINGGTVIAKGGDGKDGEAKGAPGIGSVNGGQVTVNGGKVVAVGGDDYNSTTHASGIAGNSLTALNGGNTVIISDTFDRNMATTGFNGLVWDINRNSTTGKVVDSQGDPITTVDSQGNSITNMDKLAGILDKANTAEYGNHGHTCTVYGKATMPADFPDDFNSDDTLVIGAGTQFLIPVDGPTLRNEGKITGSGTLINPNKLVNAGGTFSKDIDLIVSFDPEQDLILKDLTYTGDSFAERPDVFEYRTTRLVDGDYIPVDRTGLTYTIKKTDDPDYEYDKNGVKDAGTYELNFTYGTSKYPIDVVVKQRDIADENVQVAPIPGKDYIGRAFTSDDFNNGDVVVTYNGNTLQSKDYSFTPDPTREDAGTATMTIRAKADGNFTGERTVSFTINKVPIDEAEVTLRGGSDSVTYDGQSHKPDVDSIKLTVEDKQGTDGKTVLTVTDVEKNYSTSDFTNAGKITITIDAAKSKNFTGTYEKTFEIKPRTLIVQSITADSRTYDGTAEVRITDIDIDLAADGENSDSRYILAGDFKEISEPTELTGLVASGGKALDVAVVGPTYDQVIIEEDMRLSGEKGKNYTLAGLYETSKITTDADGKQKGPNALLKPVIIDQRDAPEIKVSGEPLPNEEVRAFGCKLTVTGLKEGVDVIDKDSVIHYYMVEEGEDAPDKANLSMWKHGTLDTLVWEDVIPPNSEREFYVFIEGSPNVKESAVVPCHVTFGKLPRSSAPSSCTVRAVPNEDGETYTLVIEPEQETTLNQPDGIYRYSFDTEGKAETYTYSDRMTNAEPNTEYTVWIKYAADEIFEESTEGTPATIKTDPLEAKQPEITCDGTTQTEGEISFYGSPDVSIEYTGNLGDGVEIYYTTDGSNPTTSSTKYSEPFKADKDKITVKAIAIKPNVATSAVTSVDLIKAGESNNPTNPGQPGGNTDVIPVIKVLDDNTIKSSPLGSTEFNTMDAVTQQMASKILLKKGYTNSQMIYCDLTIQIKRENGQYTDATEEDFAKAGNQGIRVGLTFEALKALGLPANVNGTTHNFVVSHMFSTDIPRLQVTAGQTEEPTVSKTADGNGIAFYVTGTSPLAIAWADVANSDPNPTEPTEPENPGQNPEDPEDPGKDPEDPENPTQDPENPTNNPTGQSGTTSNTDASTQGASDDSKSALSNIMPKTGDPLSFVPWIAAAVVSIGVIVGLMKKKSGKNTDKKKKPAKKTKQSTKKKK